MLHMAKIAPAGYTLSQITLHWLIAALVLFQLYFGEDMAHASFALKRGREITTNQALQINLHIWVGFAVLATVLIRLALRYRFGAPSAPQDESRIVQALGQASHHLFYILLVAVPITGILGYYWIPFFNRIHTLGKPAFIVLIALHVLAVLWHQLYKRDGVFMRMVKPAPQPVITDAIGGSPPPA
jgi:cytochrome b561